jgi:hypothetical protein
MESQLRATHDEKRSGDDRLNLLGRLVGLFTGRKADGESDFVVLVPNGEAVTEPTMTIGRLHILNARRHHIPPPPIELLISAHPVGQRTDGLSGLDADIMVSFCNLSLDKLKCLNVCHDLHEIA